MGATRIAERLTEVAARFSPPSETLARMEAAVMAEFERTIAAAGPLQTAPLGARGRRSATAESATSLRGTLGRIRGAAAVPAWRRGFAVLLAGVLAVGTVAVVAAETAPGHPLYRLRIQVEAMGLPPAGSQAWFEAELIRADQRLSELVAAGTSGDVPAAVDASAAYTEVLTDVVGGETGEESAAFAALLRRHEDALARVAVVTPSAASGSVARAVAAVRQAAATVRPAPASPPASPASRVKREIAGGDRMSRSGEAAPPRELRQQARMANAARKQRADRHRNATSGESQHEVKSQTAAKSGTSAKSDRASTDRSRAAKPRNRSDSATHPAGRSNGHRHGDGIGASKEGARHRAD